MKNRAENMMTESLKLGPTQRNHRHQQILGKHLRNKTKWSIFCHTSNRSKIVAIIETWAEWTICVGNIEPNSIEMCLQ